MTAPRLGDEGQATCDEFAKSWGVAGGGVWEAWPRVDPVEHGSASSVDGGALKVVGSGHGDPPGSAGRRWRTQSANLRYAVHGTTGSVSGERGAVTVGVVCCDDLQPIHVAFHRAVA